VFLVSHDRTFMDNVVTSTIAFEGDGRWREYEGGVTDWLTQSRRAQALFKTHDKKALQPSKDKGKQLLSSEQAEVTTEAVGSTQPSAAPAKPRKLSYKEQRELDALPDLIARLEAEQKEATDLLADGSLYAIDNARALKLAARCAEIEDELMTALERWEALS